MMRGLIGVCSLAWLLALASGAAPASLQGHPTIVTKDAGVLFTTSDSCVACHNGLTSTAGEDVSIGADWRGSIMANSSRDPYWQASVRRETLDHPTAAAAIEDECAVCHMPMARAQASSRGRRLSVFAHLPVIERTGADDLVAHDGVSCTLCHQISERKLGTPESFTGGFVLGAGRPDVSPMFGPFAVDKGRTTVMRSATGFSPTEATHIRQSELCATCHTLYTDALGADGERIGRLAEQVPYLEWRHSAFPGEGQTCQTCHMPVVRGEAVISSVLGTPRQGLARHVFRGGNAFMLRMLRRYRDALGVAALPTELDGATKWTVDQLQNDTARLAIGHATRNGDRLEFEITVQNRTGHKLPSAYPSRRAWLEVIVRGADHREIFHSGAVDPAGAITGNDNDADAARYEPHYGVIREPGQVQIYESIIADVTGAPTTGLLRAVRYIKDNRLLPRGFTRSTAHPDIAVVGTAADDDDFAGGEDRVRYSVAPPANAGPFTIEAKLHFQSIGFRWARNLASYRAAETRRFVSYYDAMANEATITLAGATIAAGR